MNNTFVVIMVGMAIASAMILIYFLYFFGTRRHINKMTVRIMELTADYFNFTGADVRLRCIPAEKKNHYILLIQSQPLKRFRFSNILEHNLAQDIFNKTGCVVDKIYWRFPVEVRKDAIVPEGYEYENLNDAYFKDEESNAQHDTKDSDEDWKFNGAGTEYVVTETTWEDFKSN